MAKKARGISLVIPARNAERTISSSLDAYSKLLASTAETYEIIVVCNASTDSTLEILKRLSKNNRKIHVLNMKKGAKGLAVLTGMKTARFGIVGFMDHDNVFNLDYVKNMIFFLERYDCVIASKWLGKNFFDVKESFTRKVLAAGWRALSFLLLGLRFSDTQAGCKFMKRKCFDAIDKDFICLGFGFDIELLFKLKQKGFSIKEFYVPIRVEKFSTFRLRYIPGMFWRLFKLWSRRLR